MACSMSSKPAANGATYPGISRSGDPATSTGASGVKSGKVNRVCWTNVFLKSVGAERESLGRTPNTSFLILDSQSVKNTDLPETSGYDAGKHVKGIKRHIAVDTNGLPHAIHLTAASVSDRDGGLEMLEHSEALGDLEQVESLLVDGGYTGWPFADAVNELLQATVQVVKRNELHTFAVLPQRWVVERSFGWLEKCRRLWKNCERKLNTSKQMVILAFLALLLRRV